MKTETKVLSGILIFSAVLLIGAVVLLGRGNSRVPEQINDQTQYDIDYSTGEKSGSDSAKVKLVEFSDFQCPACKAFDPAIKQILAENKDNIQFIYKYFPLPMHLNAKPSANFAIYAATEGKFWEIHDKLFETQDEWANLPDPKNYFLQMGKEAGLDETKIKEALDNNTYYDVMNKTFEEGQRLAVNSTPTLFINGKKANFQTFEELRQMIQQALTQ